MPNETKSNSPLDPTRDQLVATLATVMQQRDDALAMLEGQPATTEQMEQLSDVVQRQGWDAVSMRQILVEFVDSKGQIGDLIDHLRALANAENSATA